MAEAATNRKASSGTAAEPVRGTRPEGAATEADASRKVHEMFTEIAPRYDLLNHLLSLQLDRVWRARVARRLRPILQRADAVVLDLCCGTGDLAMALVREARGASLPSSGARILGADFAHTMLVRARVKSQLVPSHSGLPPEPALPVFEADALRLPFADGSFDLVTTAFGFRNLANYEAGLREMQRVLKPGGTLGILEFMEPPDGLLGNLYRWYFRSVLPKIGAVISGNRAAYSYLPKSVSRFFQPKELAALMASVGYEAVEFQTWTMGTVALHLGKRK
jgi:demethylmenaquinone methyltransferase/2-methoxy-6-polyprenyl-1,4-benzoquinol methylase